MIHLGVNPIVWSNDDMPELGGTTPLEQCLNEAKTIGFSGLELGNKFPREPNALNAVMEHHKLLVVSGWHSGLLLNRGVDDEMQSLRKHLDLLKSAGSNVLVYAETTGSVQGLRNTPVTARPTICTEQKWAEYGKKLSTLAERTLTEGIRLCFHHHMGTVVETESDIDKLMQYTTPAVSLLLDTGHATWGGINPVTLATRYLTRIAHVHAKNVRLDIATRAKREGWSFLDSVVAGVFTVPGDGNAIDFLELFRVLRSRYSGWVILEAEQDPEKANPLVYAKRGYEHLKRCVLDAGFVVS